VTLKKLIIGSILILLLSFAVSYFFFEHRYSITINEEANSLTNATECTECAANAANVEPTINPKDRQISILFAGDLMFDRHIREHAQANSNDYIFAKIKNTLLDNDFVLANLECPITDNKSRSVGSIVGSTNNFIFTCDTSIAKTLKEHNISVVNLGNNHILNFGQDGLKQTYENLDANNIKYFGNVGNDDDKRMTTVELKGLKLVFVNYNQFINNALSYALADIQKAKALEPDLIIMYPHWGAEYITTANRTIQNLAHQFIDEGADLVIGGHPHVVQQNAVYKGKTIYYSLGNFIFDQYFEKNVKNGLLVKITIDIETKTMEFEKIKIQMEKATGQTKLASPSAQTSPIKN